MLYSLRDSSFRDRASGASKSMKDGFLLATCSLVEGDFLFISQLLLYFEIFYFIALGPYLGNSLFSFLMTN